MLQAVSLRKGRVDNNITRHCKTNLLSQRFSNFFCNGTLYVVGNVTEPLFKIMLITIKEMFYLTKLIS